MKTRTVLLAITVLALAVGVFLLANATVIPHKTLTSSQGFSVYEVHDSNMRNWFELMSGGTMTPNDQAVRTVGTSGTGTVFVMKTSYFDFSCYIDEIACPNGFFAGSSFNNVTILTSYIQLHHVEILYSRIISGENVTLDYHAAVPTNVTIVFVPFSTERMTSYYGIKTSNSTVIYPVLGLTQSPNMAWSPMNISIGLIAGGTALLVITLTKFKPDPRARIREYRGPATRNCPACGGENLFFSQKCAHCQSTLLVEKPRLVAN